MFRVVVVSWNVWPELEKCLRSLADELSSTVAFEVVVVDNHSFDNSANLIKTNFPWVKVIELKENIGFARACNLGAQGVTADYILFLNPDTEITSGFFSDLTRSFIQHPQVAVIGGHIYNEDGSTQPSVRAFPGLKVGLLEALKLLARLPWLAPDYFLPKFDYSQSQEVDQVMGACYAVRTNIWQELGGFDENFFVWFEEVDYCKRAKLAGYKIWYEAKLSLIHLKGKSFQQLPYTQRHQYYISSLVKYLRKHQGSPASFLVWLVSRPLLVVTRIADYAINKK